MSFPSDTSTQLNNALSISDNYTSATTPNINFNATSGIYNPSANVIKIFTNNTDALTINASQQLSGNGTGLTNLNYSAISNLPTNFQTDWNTTIINKPSNFQSDWNTTIINKPSNFQSDWNSTIINKPDLTVYGTNTNLNNLSTNSTLSINNINATTTTILGLVNGHTTSIVILMLHQQQYLLI